MKDGIKEKRLKEIIHIAAKLKWISPTTISKVVVSYPLMQLSEVEKCMLAMIDDFELNRMREWSKEVDSGKLKPQTEQEYWDNKAKGT